MKKYPAHIAILLAYVCGGGSLIMFAAFCYAGPLDLARLGSNEAGKLLIDAGLSLAFFLQHSIMVRRSFRRQLSRLVPERYVNVIYAISSGIVLSVVILFWQETSSAVGAAKGALRLLLRVIFAGSVAGFYWGAAALGSLDAFGIRSLLDSGRARKPREARLIIRGPYRFVRHPLYLFVLVMIWSNPDLTYDRLLFNILWSAWVFVGAILEERDLSLDFGHAYEQYKRKVPMLIPWRILTTG